jgi:hypothetical protein
VVSGRVGSQGAVIIARNDFGTIGNQATSLNQAILDQSTPQFVNNGTTYPSGQAAFKGTETGWKNVVVSDFTSVIYESPTGEFSISNSTTYEQLKQITLNNPYHYNDSQVNFKITAFKAVNGTSAVFEDVLEVADVAPVVTITQPVTRLRSVGTYTITASSNQNLNTPPSIQIPVSGTWQGAGFSGGPKLYHRDILIGDGAVPGEGDWTWDSNVTNNAGIPAIIVGKEVVGGFVETTLVLPAFGKSVNINAIVTDVTKLRLRWSFKEDMVFYPIGTTPPVVYGWTIDAINTYPTKVIILDWQTANASTKESYLYVEEVE